MNLKEQTEKINDNMIFVEKGEFKPSFLKEKREVCNLFVNKYQVTQDEWKKHMKTDPSNFKGEKRPIENITWIDSLKFCNKLSENYGLQPVYKIENGKLIRIIYTTGEEVLPFEADFSNSLFGIFKESFKNLATESKKEVLKISEENPDIDIDWKDFANSTTREIVKANSKNIKQNGELSVNEEKFIKNISDVIDKTFK